jgi:hypothetical protein
MLQKLLKEKMKNNKIILFRICLLSFFFISCGHMDEESSRFVYPLETGNRWVYRTEIIRTNFEPQSLEDEFGSSETSSALCEVIGEQILLDSVKTMILGTTERTDRYQYVSHHFYQETDEGLFILAYQNAGASIIYPKSESKRRLQFKDIHFTNIHALSNFMQQALPEQKIVSDSLIYENPPVQTLKYPLEPGSQWTYRHDFNPWRIDKTVIGKTVLNLDIGVFECFHIKWLYDWDQNGVWDDDLWIDDYVGVEGLLKRTISFMSVGYVDESGNMLGTFDSFMDYTLTELYY